MRIPYYAQYDADTDAVAVYGAPSVFPRAKWQGPHPNRWGTEYWEPGPPVVQSDVVGLEASRVANAGVSSVSSVYLKSSTAGAPPKRTGNADTRPYQRLRSPRWRQSLYAYSAGQTAAPGTVHTGGHA